ncbi:hypothetical protein ACQY0O_007398 [Thecaphora frezii]
MASLSTYASRFLASGLGASVRPGDADESNEPLFYGQHSIAGAPFSHDRSNPYAPEYSLSSSDGLPPVPHQHHERPGSQSGLLHSLTGASRYGPASFIGAGRGRGTVHDISGGGGGAVRDSMIREIDDEEDVDLWRDERRMTGIASRLGASTGSEGLHQSHEDGSRPREGATRTSADTQDPFLADGDLDAEESSSVAESRGRDSIAGHSSVASPSRIYAQQASAGPIGQLSPGQAMRRAKGWLAHGSIAESAQPYDAKGKGKQSSHDRTPKSRKGTASFSSRLPNDIYRDPDVEEEEAAAALRYGFSSSHRDGERARGGKGARGGQRSAHGLYSIYDDSQTELSEVSRSRSSSISASSVTDSGSETDDEGRQHGRKAFRSSRRPQVNRNRTRNMSSTMRDPLLPVGASRYHGPRSSDSGSQDGSVSGSEQEFAGAQRDGKEEEDTAIYVYPSPPARSGWGPWANRLAVGKYKDKTAIVCFAATVAAIVLFGLSMSWGARAPAPPKTPKTRPSSYYTITRSLPILILMTLLSFAAGLGNLVLLRNFGRLGGAQVLRTGLMAVPIVLGLGWTWALAGSFIYDDEAWSGGGWSTTGLRIISIIPLALAVAFARMVWSRRKALSKSIAVIELSCQIVLEHPALLMLSIASLGAFLVLTIPFLSIFARLFLVGHFGKPVGDSMEWQTDRRAAWLAWATLATWLWTWAVLRGIQRVTVAGVVSHWYFNRNAEAATGGASGKTDLDKRQADDEQSDYVYGEDEDSIYGPGPSAPGAYNGTAPAAGRRRTGGCLSAPPNPTEIVRASFARATGPALGSICLAALILSIVRTLTLIAEAARRASNAAAERRTPKLLQPLFHVVALLAGLGHMMQGFSNLTLVYVGITGEGFWPATKKSAQMVGRRGARGAMEGLIINLVLDLTAIALSFLCGIAGFLFSAHQLHVPADAPLVGLLCAVVPYWTLRLCADVLTNAADTLYLCYAIDSDTETSHAGIVGEAVRLGSYFPFLPFSLVSCFGSISRTSLIDAYVSLPRLPRQKFKARPSSQADSILPL